jgi:hypothetical protein
MLLGDPDSPGGSMTTRVIGPAALLLCAGLVALRSPTPRPADGGVARIQEHLATVRTALHAADVSHLDAERTAARARALGYLDQYRRHGVFPHNHVVSDRRTAVFIDEHGTHCAVGYLMARTGDGSLARRIADTANLARVADLAGDPELGDWLDRNGLSVLEAAMIQPAYDPRVDDNLHDGYDQATLLLSAVDVPLIVINRPGSQSGRIAGGFGLAVGTLQAALGVAGYLEADDGLRGLSIGANLVLGAVGIGFGLKQLFGDRDGGTATSGENRQADPSFRLSPWLAPAGEAGFRVALRW